MINIVPILKNKKEFLELLLLADEQESMIDLYLERGEMFALYVRLHLLPPDTRFLHQELRPSHV